MPKYGNNEIQEYRFSVTEYSCDKSKIHRLLIKIEPYDKGLDILSNGFINFTLPEGITFEKAQEIAKFLNDNIESISYTDLS